jgi:hypothetical protein
MWFGSEIRLSRFCEGEVIGREFAAAGGGAPTLLAPVAEPLDEIARAIQLRVQASLFVRLHVGGRLAHAPC